MAHPLRLALLERLYTHGAATATELAEHVGESAANCSWHLRQLARYGFVEEAGGGKGRQRPWRAVIESRTWGHSDAAGELAIAGDAMSEVLFEHEVAALRAWVRWRRGDPPEWQDAVMVSQWMTWLTVDELREFRTLVNDFLMHRTAARVELADRPPDARMVRFFGWAIPAEPLPASGDADETGEQP